MDAVLAYTKLWGLFHNETNVPTMCFFVKPGAHMGILFGKGITEQSAHNSVWKSFVCTPNMSEMMPSTHPS